MIVSGTAVLKFYNPETGFCVGKVANAKVSGGNLEDQLLNGETVSFAGVAPTNIDLMEVEMTGDMEVGDYGEQLKVAMFSVKADRGGLMKKMLLSGMIYGVGPATGEKIWNKWGDEFHDHMLPQELIKISGIGGATADKISESWLELQANMDVIMFSLEHGLSFNVARKIYDRFGNNSSAVITQHPYRIIEVSGIGWKTADALAEKMGVSKDSDERFIYASMYAIDQVMMNGHTYAPNKKFLKKMREVVGDVSESRILAALESEENNVVIVREKGFITAPMDKVINNIVSRISSIQAGAAKMNYQPPLSTQLDEAQKKAAEMVFENGVSTITGGAGTGKTLTIKSVCESADMLGYEVALMAPTGMAADRMSVVSGREAKTIHRALGINPGRYWDPAGQELSADIIIVDETSMVDVWIAEKVLSVVKRGAHILFVGDAYQLPSVGPGEFFFSLTTSKQVPTAVLKKVYRSEGNGIVLNANKLRHINNREPINFDLDGINYMYARSMELICERIPRDYMLLAAFKHEVATANRILQERFNPDKRRVKFSDNLILSVGDPIRITKNNYDLNVFNGMRGTVTWIRDEGDGWFKRNGGIFDEELPVVNVEIAGTVYEMTKQQAKKLLVLSYASTIHSAQGNEWNKVAVIVPYSNNTWTQKTFLTASLLYTAMTRPRKHLVLIERNKAALKHYQTARAFARRYTLLPDALKELDVLV